MKPAIYNNLLFTLLNVKQSFLPFQLFYIKVLSLRVKFYLKCEGFT